MNTSALSEASSEHAAALLPRGALVVSCQAPEGHPFDSPDVIARLARCAELGGARAVRVAGAENIRAVRQRTSLPIMGITKVRRPAGLRPLITPSVEDVDQIVAAGANLVAVDASFEAHPVDDSLRDIVAHGLKLVGVVVADISTHAEAVRANRLGATMVATTLSGYTPESLHVTDGPDLGLLEAVSREGIDCVLEGRVTSVAEVSRARELGARAIVVGGAISDPVAITRRLNTMCITGRHE